MKMVQRYRAPEQSSESSVSWVMANQGHDGVDHVVIKRLACPAYLLYDFATWQGVMSPTSGSVIRR